MAEEKPSKSKNAGSITRLLRASANSLEGLRVEFSQEPAFRLEVYLSVILVLVALLLPVPPLSRALLIGSLFLVMIVELINCALESTVDYISVKRDPRAKRIKDAASGAVFIAIANAVIIWAVIIFTSLRGS